MARPGDPSVRPLDTCAVAFSVDNMDHELDRLSMHGIVAELGGNQPVVEPEVIKRAICHQFLVRPEDVTVVRHAPEDFFIDFKHRHHRDEAVARGTFPYRNLDIHTRPWQLVTHGDICDLKYRVRLCLEGISLHAWNESIDKRAVTRACDLDYIEKSSLDRADTRALCVWAWTHNPSDIPKVTWLTLSCRKTEAHSSQTARGRRGLTFRVLVHLDLVEDPPDRDEHAAAPRVYTWDYGVVDGERTPRDHHDPPPADIHGSHRDDDNDRRGRRERQGANWHSRLTRSLSRAPKYREWERSESRHGGRRHRSLELGGRRCPLHDIAAGHGARQSAPGDAWMSTAEPGVRAGNGCPTGGRTGTRAQSRGPRRRSQNPRRYACAASHLTSAVATATTTTHHQVLPRFPVGDHDIMAQQRSSLADDCRFRTGRVYSRRPCAPRTHRNHAQPAEKPRWCVFTLASSTPDAVPAVWPAAALAVHVWQMASSTNCRNTLAPPWSLFKGPLTDDTVKVLTALCGLDAAAALPTTHA
ncbi:unnamed protein product [Miscanthus lutarioriparius]|uniref:Uncharacterized protein n=1 Tax=Miscanthus lutarioriparius TaxID=422564 RepID=A0A811QKY6_9POAL|nr:unnamed protein product [Miscanthus lutarioriparius]